MQILEASGGHSTDEDDSQNHPPMTYSRHRRTPRQLRPRSASLEACLIGMYRRTGSRQARRTDNIKHLLSLVDREEEGESSQMPTYNSNVSAFATLLQEREKMQVWNHFISCSEEEQEYMLHRPLASIREEVENEEASSLDDSWEEVKPEPNISGDRRADHPSFSAQECFGRIDRHLRSILTRRHLPVGILAQLEEDVVSFFKDCPDSVFVLDHTSGYERLLLHAVCQFLGLHCHSYDDNGSRRTQVENRYLSFCPPAQSLSQFLESFNIS